MLPHYVQLIWEYK